jgi:spermidine synthase
MRTQPAIQPIPFQAQIALALFLVSGFAALLYQVVWSRMLTLVFGNTVYATSATLAAYMGGLAIGSFAFGRFVDRWRGDPLRLYAVLEAGIGLFGLASPWLIDAVDGFALDVQRATAASSAQTTAVRFGVAFLMLLVPTSLMGGTLPALSRWWSDLQDDAPLGSEVGQLYSVNTLGAFAGCTLTGFLLIRSLGVSSTLYLGAAVTLSVAAAAVLLSLRRGAPPGPSRAARAAARSAGRPPSEPVEEAPRRLRAFAFAAFAYTGFAALAMEVIWMRMLVFHLSSSTYAFSAMLGSFLFGLFAGSWIGARYPAPRESLARRYGVTLVLIGLSCVASLLVLTQLFSRLDSAFEDLQSFTWGGAQVLKFAKSFAVMAVPTFLMGYAFPLALQLWAGGRDRIGAHVGSLYAANTVGAIVGATSAAFLIIPGLGLTQGVKLISAGTVALGVGLLLLARPRPLAGTLLRASIVAAAAAGCALLPTGELILRRATEQWTELLFYQEGTGSTVKVFRDLQGVELLSIDGYRVAGSGDRLRPANPEIQKALGHLPMLLHPGAKDVLVIGFGAGGTTRAIVSHGAPNVQVAEITPGVLAAAPLLRHVHGDVLAEPTVHLHLEDGRHFLRLTDTKYDVIAVDAIDPKHATNGNLYAYEFFDLCRRSLREDGLVALWLPHHLVSAPELAIIAASFHAVFPSASVWQTPHKSYLLLLGGPAPLSVSWSRIQAGLQKRAVREDLDELYVRTPLDVLDGFVAAGQGLTGLLELADGLNTYDRPRIEFFDYSDPVADFSREAFRENVRLIARLRQSVWPWLRDVADASTPEGREQLGRARTQYWSRYVAHTDSMLALDALNAAAVRSAPPWAANIGRDLLRSALLASGDAPAFAHLAEATDAHQALFRSAHGLPSLHVLLGDALAVRDVPAAALRVYRQIEQQAPRRASELKLQTRRLRALVVQGRWHEAAAAAPAARQESPELEPYLAQLELLARAALQVESFGEADAAEAADARVRAALLAWATGELRWAWHLLGAARTAEAAELRLWLTQLSGLVPTEPMLEEARRHQPASSPSLQAALHAAQRTMDFGRSLQSDAGADPLDGHRALLRLLARYCPELQTILEWRRTLVD